MRRYVSLAALALALFVCATAADAQDFRGGITGRITDAQGGRLPGVTVTATNVATNVASTDDDRQRRRVTRFPSSPRAPTR